MIVDRTAEFFQLADAKPHSEQAPPALDKTSTEQLFNEFSEDIFITIRSAQSVLEQSRENYFSNTAYSNSAFSNQQRQDFDNEIKQMLQNIIKRINELAEMIKGDEFARTDTHANHYTGAIGCLYQASKRPNASFREFVEHSQKLKLKLLKLMDVNHNERPLSEKITTSTPATNNTSSEPYRRRQSNPELQQQSKILLIRNSDKRDQIMQAQTLLTTINKMLDETSNKVLEQEFQTSTIMKIGEDTISTVKKGNINLVQANTYSKKIGKHWIWFFNTLTVLILLLDFLKS